MVACMLHFTCMLYMLCSIVSSIFRGPNGAVVSEEQFNIGDQEVPKGGNGRTVQSSDG